MLQAHNHDFAKGEDLQPTVIKFSKMSKLGDVVS